MLKNGARFGPHLRLGDLFADGKDGGCLGVDRPAFGAPVFDLCCLDGGAGQGQTAGNAYVSARVECLDQCPHQMLIAVGCLNHDLGLMILVDDALELT